MRQATPGEIEQAAGMTLAFVPNPEADRAPEAEARVAGYIVNALSPVPAECVEGLRDVFGVIDFRPSEDERRAAEARRASGLFNLSEAAELMREAAGQPEGASHDTQFRQLEDAAARRGELDPLRLTVLHPQTLMPEDFAEWPGPSSMHLVVRREELSRWLQAVGAGFALPQEQQHHSTHAAPAGLVAGVEEASAPTQDPHEGPVRGNLSMDWRIERLTTAADEARTADPSLDRAHSGKPGLRAAVKRIVRAKHGGKATWSDDEFKHAWDAFLILRKKE